MLITWFCRISVFKRPHLCAYHLFRMLSTSGSSQERPNMYHLDHVRKRLEFTVPLMFRQRLDFTFFSYDVICEDYILNVQRVGLDRLMRHLGLYSVACQFFFPHIEMEALSIIPMLEDGTVRLRWRVKHVSWWRTLTNPFMFSYSYRIKRLRWYDGYSIFFVNGDGFVSKMTIQKTIPDDERVAVKKTATQKLAEKIGVLPKETAATFTRIEEQLRKIDEKAKK